MRKAAATTTTNARTTASNDDEADGGDGDARDPKPPPANPSKVVVDVALVDSTRQLSCWSASLLSTSLVDSRSGPIAISQMAVVVVDYRRMSAMIDARAVGTLICARVVVVVDPDVVVVV